MLSRVFDVFSVSGVGIRAAQNSPGVPPSLKTVGLCTNS
nr:MAG TPA: hypothetical protein [Caudoviricetes sp.]